VNYSDDVCEWLVEQGYTHCFFVAGGNIMHILNSARTRFNCVPFVHEVACGIATEYFNEVSGPDGGRAFALVTAGPGVTNIVTAIAGAFLESRELLIIGGQVKASDLSRGEVRQRGIQEIDGVTLTKPLCNMATQIVVPIPKSEFLSFLRQGISGRPGPVFIEFCLDAQAATSLTPVDSTTLPSERPASVSQVDISEVGNHVLNASRPLLLIGGGISRVGAEKIIDLARILGIPCATTWNAADRVASDDPIYAGRPNTWGMRWANVVLQQSDHVIAAGTRLGLQQTGFNWQEFAPLAKIIQIDIDPRELVKGHPRVFETFRADANVAVPAILQEVANASRLPAVQRRWEKWQQFICMVRDELPLEDTGNQHSTDFIQPYDFMTLLSHNLSSGDVIIPCSSGGAFTVTMQALLNKAGQIIVTNKGLASMGYGLSGAIGAALAKKNSRVVLIEGDGGFAQNIQELGTLKRNLLNVKIFLFSNNGYASIRMTQRNYFDGAYLGCDTETGLGLPNWELLCRAYGIPSRTFDPNIPVSPQIAAALSEVGPEVIVVPIDPEQTYYPKITSRITESGSMESNPLHLMSPELTPELSDKLLPFLKPKKKGNRA
jgi:acetolactate synthase-1/2/3 large subunit